MTSLLATEGVSRRFRDRLFRPVEAVREISIEISEGEALAFVGPNGSGKSTLFYLILRLLAPTAGKVYFRGAPLVRGDEAFREIGYLPEEAHYPMECTAAEAVSFFGSVAGVSLSRPAVLARLEEVGIGEAADRKVGRLSKGMRQRLGFALAFLHHPRILFLDEPFRGIDPLGVAELRRLLIKRRQEDGVTLLINTHILGEVEALADRVAFLDHGRLLEVKSLRDIQSESATVYRVLLRGSDGANREEWLEGDLMEGLTRMTANGEKVVAVLPVSAALEEYLMKIMGKAS